MNLPETILWLPAKSSRSILGRSPSPARTNSFADQTDELLKREDGVECLVDGFERSVEHVAGVLCSVAAEAEIGVGVGEELVRSEAADVRVIARVAVDDDLPDDR